MQKRLFYLPLILIGLLVAKGTAFGQWMPMLSESVSIDPFSGAMNKNDGELGPFCTNTVITSQPSSTSVCNPSGASFSVVASGVNLTYRWEVNYGTVWNTISNGSLYTGVNAATLNIAQTTSSMNGYQYRCVIGSDCPNIYSSVVTLTVVAINPVITAGSALTFCQGGSVVLTSSSASGNTWSNGETTQSITATSSGSYSVTVNANGCTETSASTVVTANPPNVAAISYAGSPFCSNQNGTFPVTLTGTTGGTFSASDNKLSVSQSNGSIVPNAGTNAIGTFTVTYTTPAWGGCPGAVATTQVTITKASSATISYGATAVCGGSSTPRQVTVTGTQGGTFSSTPAGLNINPATGAIIGSQSTPGTYTVTYTNAATGGCPAASTNTQVTVSEAVSATISYAGSAFCTSPAGSVPVVLTGTTGGTFSATPSGLSINSSTGRITPYASTPGIYTVNYSMASPGCAATVVSATVEIVQQPSAPVVTASGPLSVCSGESVVLTSSAATGNTWSNGETTQSITVNTSGNYSVTTTVDHCAASPASQVKTVTVKALPVITLGTVSHPASCGANGSIQVLGSGTGTLNWTGSASGSVSATLPYNIQLPAGTYTITFTGSNGCTSLPLTQTLNNPSGSVPTISANGPTSFCTGGSVILTSSSATGNVWSTGATTQSITVNATGNYSVTVTVSGCATTSLATAVNVTTLSTPYITGNGPMVVCSGEQVVLTSSASTGNVWSNGETTPSITVSATGTYTVTVTSGGCSKTSGPSTVTVHPLPVISTGTVVNPACLQNNGTIQINGTGTGVLSWTGPVSGNSTITSFPFVMSNLSAGTYSITFVNSSNCVSTVLVQTLTDPGVPATPVITADGALTFCAGEDVVLTSSASAGNVWSNGATTQSITVNSSGSYTVSVSAGGCSSTSASTSVTVNPVSTIALGTVSNPASCGTATGSIQVTGTGSGTLNWTGAVAGTAALQSLPFVISNLGSGAYSISLTNPNGCVSNTLTQSLSDPGAPATPVITASGSTTFCSGGSVVLTSSATAGNVWSTGETSQSITVNSAGSYSVTVSNAGCSSTSSPTGVTVNPVHAVSTGTLVNPSACLANTGSIEINGTGTGTLNWTGAATGNAAVTAFPYVIQNLGAGTYTFTFNSGGCVSGPVSATLNDPATPATPVIAAGGSTALCSGGNVVLTSSATAGNLWSTGETTQSITVNSAGTYTVSVSTSGCSATSAGTVVTVATLPVISAGTVVNETCSQSNGSFQVTGSGTGILNWTGTAAGTANVSTFPHTIPNLGAGTYTITFTNGSGCVSSALTQTITNTPAPATPTIAANGPLTFCSGGNVVLTSSSATGNLWSTGVTTQSITVTNAGTYTLTVGTTGCTATASVSVTVTPLPNTTLAALKPVCSYEPSFALTGGLPAGGTYSGTGVTGGNFNPATAGVGTTVITYTVTQNGCSKSAASTITVNGCLGIDEEGAEDLLIIYPNPTTGIFHLEGANLSGYAKVELLDATGRLVQSWKINASAMTIDVSGIATGNYNLHVSGKEGHVVKKVQVF